MRMPAGREGREHWGHTTALIQQQVEEHMDHMGLHGHSVTDIHALCGPYEIKR